MTLTQLTKENSKVLFQSSLLKSNFFTILIITSQTVRVPYKGDLLEFSTANQRSHAKTSTPKFFVDATEILQPISKLETRVLHSDVNCLYN